MQTSVSIARDNAEAHVGDKVQVPSNPDPVALFQMGNPRKAYSVRLDLPPDMVDIEACHQIVQEFIEHHPDQFSSAGSGIRAALDCLANEYRAYAAAQPKTYQPGS